MPRLDVRETSSQLWMWAIVVLGLGLRTVQYARNRSLWLDEALLALNILHRPASGLFQGLDYHQGAPVGFLLLEKLATKLAGGGELTLRAFPLAFGFVGLFFFWRMAKLYVDPGAIPFALSLFAFCGSLIYYSSEVKQYSSDVAVTIMLLWLLSKLAGGPLTSDELVRSSALGALAIWVSHPAVFILSGAGLALLVFALVRNDWPRLARMSWVCGIWALSFAICYFVSLQPLSKDHSLLDFWRDYFPPQPLWSWKTLRFLIEGSLKLFDDPAQLLSSAGAVICVLGCINLARKNSLRFWLLSAPLLATALAGILHRYPLGGRFLLFALPILFLMIGEGAIAIAEAGGRFARPVQIFLLVLLLAKPVWLDVRSLIYERNPDDIKPAIQYAQAHQQPGDGWYVYHFARYQFWYYAQIYQMRPRLVRIGVDCGTESACYAEDLDPLRGQPRVWILFSHIRVQEGRSEEEIVLNHLDHLGVRVDAYKSIGARAYLYDLSEPPVSATPAKN